MVGVRSWVVVLVTVAASTVAALGHPAGASADDEAGFGSAGSPAGRGEGAKRAIDGRTAGSGGLEPGAGGEAAEDALDTALWGYGTRTLNASACHPREPFACSRFTTQIRTWDQWLPPSDHAKVLAGVSSPRWYGSVPWNPYSIRLETRFACSGHFISVRVPLGWSRGSTWAEYHWPDVLNNWRPDFFYPEGSFQCDAFELGHFSQSDTTYITVRHGSPAWMIPVSDSERIGIF